MVPKKIRFDFYKAIQAAQFHTANLLDHEGEMPENEADAVIDFIDKLTVDLERVKERLTSSNGIGA